MENPFKEIREDLEDLIEEPGLMQRSRNKRSDRVYLWIRNVCVGISTLLFILSFFLHDCHTLLRGIAYFSGAGAYFAEFGILTDSFSRKVPSRELFMAYCFGPLYILMGLAYLLE